jgi:ferrous iron transport protein A
MVAMMPLTMAKAGEQNSIKKVGGQTEVRQFLENLGFTPGSQVTVVSQISGNVIVNVRESRVAISREMASKIMI